MRSMLLGSDRERCYGAINLNLLDFICHLPATWQKLPWPFIVFGKKGLQQKAIIFKSLIY